MLLHLRKAPVIGDVPHAVAAELGLAGCCWTVMLVADSTGGSRLDDGR